MHENVYRWVKLSQICIVCVCEYVKTHTCNFSYFITKLMFFDGFFPLAEKKILIEILSEIVWKVYVLD